MATRCRVCRIESPESDQNRDVSERWSAGDDVPPEGFLEFIRVGVEVG